MKSNLPWLPRISAFTDGDHEISAKVYVSPTSHWLFSNIRSILKNIFPNKFFALSEYSDVNFFLVDHVSHETLNNRGPFVADGTAQSSRRFFSRLSRLSGNTGTFL